MSFWPISWAAVGPDGVSVGVGVGFGVGVGTGVGFGAGVSVGVGSLVGLGEGVAGPNGVAEGPLEAGTLGVDEQAASTRAARIARGRLTGVA